jgi:hypothetical protein
MLWPASIDPQRPAPRGEAVTTCAGHTGFLILSTMNPEHQWWRS